MQKNFKTILFFFFFTSLSTFSYSQEGKEMCFHFVKNSPENELHTYLINKYGEGEAERITLNVRNYEKLNSVKVLPKDLYYNKLEMIDAEINQTQNEEIISQLIARKAKYVLFQAIEHQLN
jgi:hypothetical protein